jgi:hypothetical protein
MLGLDQDGATREAGRHYADAFTNSTYREALRMAESQRKQRETAKVAREKVIRDAAMLKLLNGALRPVLQSASPAAHAIAARVVDGKLKSALKVIEGTAIALRRYRRGGYGGSYQQTPVMVFRVKDARGRWIYFPADKGPETEDAYGRDYIDDAAFVESYKTPGHRWKADEWKETTEEIRTRLMKSHPTEMKALAKLYSKHEHNRHKQLDALPWGKIVMHGGAWGVKSKQFYSSATEWLVVNKDGRKQSVNSKAYKALVETQLSPEEKKHAAGARTKQKQVSAAFDKAVAKSAAGAWVPFALPALGYGGYARKSYSEKAEREWDKDEKHPDVILAVTAEHHGVKLSDMLTRGGPRSPWSSNSFSSNYVPGSDAPYNQHANVGAKALERIITLEGGWNAAERLDPSKARQTELRDAWDRAVASYKSEAFRFLAAWISEDVAGRFNEEAAYRYFKTQEKVLKKEAAGFDERVRAALSNKRTRAKLAKKKNPRKRR